LSWIKAEKADDHTALDDEDTYYTSSGEDIPLVYRFNTKAVPADDEPWPATLTADQVLLP